VIFMCAFPRLMVRNKHRGSNTHHYHVHHHHYWLQSASVSPVPVRRASRRHGGHSRSSSEPHPSTQQERQHTQQNPHADQELPQQRRTEYCAERIVPNDSSRHRYIIGERPYPDEKGDTEFVSQTITRRKRRAGEEHTHFHIYVPRGAADSVATVRHDADCRAERGRGRKGSQDGIPTSPSGTEKIAEPDPESILSEDADEKGGREGWGKGRQESTRTRATGTTRPRRRRRHRRSFQDSH